MRRQSQEMRADGRSTARQKNKDRGESEMLRDRFAGSVAIILTVGGTLSFFLQPQVAPQFWAIIGPIIVGAMGWTRRSKNHHE